MEEASDLSAALMEAGTEGTAVPVSFTWDAKVFCNLFADKADLEQVVESAGFVSGSVEWLRFLDGIEICCSSYRAKPQFFGATRNFVARQGLSLVFKGGSFGAHCSR